MATPERFDVIVVGAGVIGAAIALELQRAGRSVVVVDKGGAVGGGSTGASSSIVRFNYSTVEGVVASREAWHRWLAWDDHLGDVEGPLCRFHECGLLVLEPPGTDRSVTLANFDRVGVPYDELDADELAERFPAIDTRRFWPPRLPDDARFFDEPDGARLGGLLMPDSGFVDDPQLAAVNLMDAARHHGTEVRLRSEVVEIADDGGRVAGVVLASGDRLWAPVVVNAAGPWSATVNELAGVTGDMSITTRALRQDVGAAEAPIGHRLGDGGVMIVDLDLGAYSRPQPGGSLLVGGVEADCDPVVWVDDPDATGPEVDPVVWEAVMFRTARRLPTLAVPHRPNGLADHYDVTDDWVPIYDRSSLDGFYMAVGTSGNQFKTAPLVGELMAALIDEVEGGADHDRDPVRFDCRETGQVLDLGHYSRRRTPLPTSGTVLG